MKVTVEIENNGNKIIYPGDNPELNVALYRLLELIYSETDFTLHHDCYKEEIDLECFNAKKFVTKVEHHFRFDINGVGKW